MDSYFVEQSTLLGVIFLRHASQLAENEASEIHRVYANKIIKLIPSHCNNISISCAITMVAGREWEGMNECWQLSKNVMSFYPSCFCRKWINFWWSMATERGVLCFQWHFHVSFWQLKLEANDFRDFPRPEKTPEKSQICVAVRLFLFSLAARVLFSPFCWKNITSRAIFFIIFTLETCLH